MMTAFQVRGTIASLTFHLPGHLDQLRQFHRRRPTEQKLNAYVCKIIGDDLQGNQAAVCQHCEQNRQEFSTLQRPHRPHLVLVPPAQTHDWRRDSLAPAPNNTGWCKKHSTIDSSALYRHSAPCTCTTSRHIWPATGLTSTCTT